TTLLGEVDGLRRRANNRYTGIFERLREGKRCLPAELDDDPGHPTRLLLGMDDFEDVLESQGLEVEPIRGVVVRRHRLRVAVDHHGLEAGLAQGGRRVPAGVGELE